MQAWSVAVLAGGPHGQHLTAIFVVAATRGEAVATAVRHVFDSLTAPDGVTPAITICGTQATSIGSEVIEAAAAELGVANKQPGDA